VLEASVLKSQILRSTGEPASVLRPKRAQNHRSMIFNLSLTSLIDAFSILVIFLLVNFSGANYSLKLSKGMQLPSAIQSNVLQTGTVVSVHENHFFIDEKEVKLTDITHRLYTLHKSLQTKGDNGQDNLIIKADRKTQFASLNPIIMAGSHAGYQHFKFAVLQEAGKK
jgi:biopolymer transport protein ExbD